MRTRFLNVDYFFSSSASSFFNLPILPPPDPAPDRLSSDRSAWFDDRPVVRDTPLDTSELRIEEALSQLLENVFPNAISVQYGSCQPEFSPEEAALGVVDVQLQCASTESGVDKSSGYVESVQFNIPELEMHQEDPAFEKELMDIFSDYSPILNDRDIFNQGHELHYNHETVEALYSFGNIGVEYLMEPKADLVEDAQDRQHFRFPLLEVEEIIFRTFSSISAEDEFAGLLRDIKGQLQPQIEDFTFINQRNWRSLELELLEAHSHECPSTKCHKDDPGMVEIFLEVDFISIGDAVYPLQRKQDEYHFTSFNTVVLEESLILDGVPAPSSEIFSSCKSQEQEGCEEMSKKEFSCKSFDELIVIHELALADDMFKPLPVPVWSECKTMKSLYEVAGKAFACFKPQPPSASDEIYLDWHLLEEDKRSSAVCSYLQNMVAAINMQSIDFDWTISSFSDAVLDLISYDYGSDSLITKEHDQTTGMLFSGGSVLDGHVVAAPSEFTVGQRSHQGQSTVSEENLNRASSVFNSMLQFNDLDFFLNPYNDGMKRKPLHPSLTTNGTTVEVESDASLATCDRSDRNLRQNDFVVHQIHLPHNLIVITENLKRSYLSILKSKAELKEVHRSFKEVDEFNLLSVPKLVFIDCMKNLGRQMSAVTARGELIMACATLYAIKQITWYLCFYGDHVGRSYLDNLCEGFCWFASQLREVQRSLVETDGKADVARIGSNSVLSVVKDIVLSSIKENASRALLVADKVFWSALKMLLTSLGILFHEMDESVRYSASDLHYHGDSSVKKTRISLAGACLLASPENISADFPFNKFDVIIEYGGSCGSSGITPLLPKLPGMPCLHFLKVEFDKSSAAGALCEGVNMARATFHKDILAGQAQELNYMDEHLDPLKLEKLLNFVPLGDIGGFSEKEESHFVPTVCKPLSAGAKDVESAVRSFPDLVVIMNTQYSEKEMIVSRRSTYQKILALERKGAQVIERDSNLPADIIISPAACLVWYDCNNMVKKGSVSHDSPSCLTSQLENIAANVLSFLSFSFSCCIMIFEGESRFLATMVELSDDLYAAAASLGIDLQIFCSYSAELTDEIILSCIDVGTTYIKDLFPKLPDSETFAESFLSRFPSINPLTAHAIVSSGGMLADFLEWSYESRINAVQKYYVPEESISLFSALCRYGEREDTQSVMTDSSSSVSSGPDSKNCRGNLGSESKGCKNMRNPPGGDIPVDNWLPFEPARQSVDNILKYPELFKYNSQETNEVEHQDVKGCESSMEYFLGGKKRCDYMGNKFSSRTENLNYFDDLSKDAAVWNIDTSHPYVGPNKATTGRLDSLLRTMKYEKKREEVRGEVIDLVDPAVFSPIDLSFLAQDMDYDTIKVQDHYFGRTFPTVAEIECSSYSLGPEKHEKYSSRVDVGDVRSQERGNERLVEKNQGSHSDVYCDRTHSRSMAMKGERSNSTGTPLRHALLHSSQLQRGSPWTVEFLNRIREKGKSRQQMLPPETSPYPSIRRNAPNRVKRRSPSILEYFKYQGGSSGSGRGRKIAEQKRQKTCSQSQCGGVGSLKDERKPRLVTQPCTRTPADKRARRMLYFATDQVGSGSQTKLVWGDCHWNAHNRL